MSWFKLFRKHTEPLHETAQDRVETIAPGRGPVRTASSAELLAAKALLAASAREQMEPQLLRLRNRVEWALKNVGAPRDAATVRALAAGLYNSGVRYVPAEDDSIWMYEGEDKLPLLRAS